MAALGARGPHLPDLLYPWTKEHHRRRIIKISLDLSDDSEYRRLGQRVLGITTQLDDHSVAEDALDLGSLRHRCDGKGRPIAILVTAGQRHEATVFEPLMEAGAIKRI